MFYKNIGYLAGFISAVAFALVNIFTSTAIGSELGHASTSDLFLVFFRSLFLLPLSVLACAIFYKRAFLETKIILQQGRSGVFFSAAAVAISIIMSQLFLIFSVEAFGSVEATYLFYAFPIFIPILCYIILKSRIYWYHFLIGALLFAFITSMGNLHQANLLFYALPLMAALFFGIYVVFGEKVCQKIHPLSLSLISSLFVFIFSLTASLLCFSFNEGVALFFSSFHLSAIFVGIFGAVGYITGIIALRHIGSKLTALISTFAPAIVAIVGYFYLSLNITGNDIALISIVPLLALPLLADDIFFLRKKSPNALVTDNALANQSKVEKVEMNFGFVSKKTYDLMINPLNFAIENLGINSSVSIDDINNSKLLIGTCGELCSVLENNTHLQHDQCLCIVKSDREVDRAIKNQFTPIYIGQGAGLSYQTWQLKTSIRDFFWRKFIQASYPLLSYTDQQTTLPPQHSDQPISTRYMYIVTVDMRDYTIFCENKSPADIFNFQYHFLGALTPPVRENQGLIVEFTGDGFLSTFDSAVNAISAVKAMFSALDKFNKDFGYKVKIGIGLDAGSAAISTIGEPNRWTLGLTSDAIITAASIESLSKLYSANVLATEEFVSNLKKDDQSSVNCQLLDAPKIKGRRHAIRLYKLDLAH